MVISIVFAMFVSYMFHKIGIFRFPNKGESNYMYWPIAMIMVISTVLLAEYIYRKYARGKR